VWRRDLIQESLMSIPVRREILATCDGDDGLYLLILEYEEGNAGDAVGGVHRAGTKRAVGSPPEQVLSTGDALTTLWLSPSGNLWVGSATGRVATTAAVGWSPATSGVARGYQGLGSRPDWRVAELPRLQASGLPPNISALWGIDDEHVFAGTYGGHIYAWDGQAWTQRYASPDKPRASIRAFGGSMGSVFAVGEQGLLLHFDSRRWQDVPLTGTGNGHESFTGIRVLTGGDILVSGAGDQGRVLHGTERGLNELARCEVPLLGMASIDHRVLFATGDGAAELIGNGVQVIKQGPLNTGICAGRGRAHFIEAEQPRPSIIEFDPREASPWVRRKY
jgi:hypothetical protein